MTATREFGPDVTALAQRHAPEVWESALRAAKEQATAVLTRQLTEAILAGAAGLQPGPVPEPGELDVTDARGLCAYAITWSWAAVPENVARLDAGRALRTIIHENLAVVVAPVDVALFAGLEKEAGQGAEVSADSRLAVLAREHDAVVRAVFDGGPALPLRFGTVVRDDRAALRLLEEQRDGVSEWLSRIESHREWGVRVIRPEPAPVPDVPIEGISGTEYLVARARQLDGDQRAQALARSAVDTLHASLSSCSTDATYREQAHAFFDAAYLVRRDQEEAFHARVRDLEDRLAATGATLQTTGPWPPYSFAPRKLVVTR